MKSFDICYKKMQLEVGLLQHQMKIRRKHFEAWWEEILWIREREASKSFTNRIIKFLTT